MSAAPALDLVQDLDQAAALLHPTRLRVLEGLAEPDSAAGLARRLGLPRQQVNYHLRELEKRQLIEEVDQRRKGNCIERIVRATAFFKSATERNPCSLAVPVLSRTISANHGEPL